MQNPGRQYVLRVEDIKPNQINDLIDQGIRFVVKAGLIEGIDEFDSLEDVLNGEVCSLHQS